MKIATAAAHIRLDNRDGDHHHNIPGAARISLQSLRHPVWRRSGTPAATSTSTCRAAPVAPLQQSAFPGLILNKRHGHHIQMLPTRLRRPLLLRKRELHPARARAEQNHARDVRLLWQGVQSEEVGAFDGTADGGIRRGLREREYERGGRGSVACVLLNIVEELKMEDWNFVIVCALLRIGWRGFRGAEPWWWRLLCGSLQPRRGPGTEAEMALEVSTTVASKSG
ncbi:hypothetical protein ANO11243_017710 [Dothideomycetidae sp. 11243]|nr:hypothetical protein ANO11243_017710 [fungal sp. No.11243]